MADVFMRTYVIYVGPGQEYAVREFHILRIESTPVAGPVLGGAATLELARALIPAQADACFPRSPEDDPAIVETWI